MVPSENMVRIASYVLGFTLVLLTFSCDAMRNKLNPELNDEIHNRNHGVDYFSDDGVQDLSGVLIPDSDSPLGRSPHTHLKTSLSGLVIEDYFPLPDRAADMRHYDFDRSVDWAAADFQTRWNMVRHAESTPRQNLTSGGVGPLCVPVLEGPTDSKKLAILMHGFLSCPGMWYRIVPDLIAAGFRVMRPTLPGHGRRFKRHSDHVICDSNAEQRDGESYDDDLAGMPNSSSTYLKFAKMLGDLANQFKREHPDGIVVAAGHSLGGVITAQYAMQLPKVVDHVLLLNPMFGHSHEFLASFGSLILSDSKILHKGSSCDKKRFIGSGGICQFQLAHVDAMSQLASEVLCCTAGVEEACKQIFGYPMWEWEVKCLEMRLRTPENDNGHNSAGLIAPKRFQMVTSMQEPLIDNRKLRQFLGAVRQVQKRLGTPTDFCKWPSDFGHSYLSNKPRPPLHLTKWWHPYLEGVIVRFLTEGKNIDIMRMPDRCLIGSEDVYDRALTMLPATQHKSSYEIAGWAVNWGSLTGRSHHVYTASVLFAADVTKQSRWFHRVNQRHVEIVSFESGFFPHSIIGFPTNLAIITRLEKNGDIRDIFLPASKNVELWSRADGRSGIDNRFPHWRGLGHADCVKVALKKARPWQPLQDELERAADQKEILYNFCSLPFREALCNVMTCTESEKPNEGEFEVNLSD